VERREMMDTAGLLSRLFLVRHGETTWSLSGQHTGRTDIPLIEQGEQDARKLAERLHRVTFSRVFTSPLRRARRTCELAGLDEFAEIEPDLAEWDYGEYEGRRLVEIRDGRPGWNLFRDGRPGGESPAQVCERADRLIARLRTMAGNIAVFTHGSFGRALAVRWIGLPVMEAEHFLLGTASLGILGHGHDLAEEPAIVLWNSAANDILA
jgi:broad specificity phosphatase PhoE